MQLEYLNAAAVKLAADPVFGLAGEEEPQPAASSARLAIAAAIGLARRDRVRAAESRFVCEGWMVCIAAASSEAVTYGWPVVEGGWFSVVRVAGEQADERLCVGTAPAGDRVPTGPGTAFRGCRTGGPMRSR